MFEKISQMKRPLMEKWRETSEILKEVLHEDYYATAPDALGMLDLTPKALGVEPDSIRVLLTKVFSKQTQFMSPGLITNLEVKDELVERSPAGK